MILLVVAPSFVVVVLPSSEDLFRLAESRLNITRCWWVHCTSRVANQVSQSVTVTRRDRITNLLDGEAGPPRCAHSLFPLSLPALPNPIKSSFLLSSSSHIFFASLATAVAAATAVIVNVFLSAVARAVRSVVPSEQSINVHRELRDFLHQTQRAQTREGSPQPLNKIELLVDSAGGEGRKKPIQANV